MKTTALGSLLPSAVDAAQRQSRPATPSFLQVRPENGSTKVPAGDTHFPTSVFIGNVCGLCCCKESRLATNFSFDPELIDRALAVSGDRTKKAVVTRALKEFIARRRQKRLL